MTIKFNQNNSTSVNPQIAAIWARVSTDKQSETSLPSQVSRCREKLKAEGFIVPESNIFTTDWTSLELLSCPEYLQLYSLIYGKKIQAVGFLNRDRLSANYDERLMFFADCRKNNITVIPCDGTPIEDSDIGQVVEHIYTIGKKQAVLRAQIGSLEGLHDRVNLKHLPITFRDAYGYTWKGETTDDKERELTLIPTPEWSNVKLIFDLLQDNKGYGFIINELKRRGIPSPSGQLDWNKNAISNINRNPLYAGRYYSLKKKAVTPKKRKGNTYGKTSLVYRPEAEWFYITEVKIINPPINWEQYQQLRQQAEDRQKYSPRNSKFDYLLKGRIFCNTHVGKNGQPRIYHGRPHHGSYAYACSVGKCERAHLPGPILDEYVKNSIAYRFIVQPDEFFQSDEGKQEQTQFNIESQLISLSKKLDSITDREAKLEDDRYSGIYDNRDEVYQRLKEKYQFELRGVDVQRDELLNELNNLYREKDALKSYMDIRLKYIDRLVSDERIDGKEDSFSNSEWRELFNSINLKITVNSKETRKKALYEYASKVGYVLEEATAEKLLERFNPDLDINIKIGIPLPAHIDENPKGETPKEIRNSINDIVLVNPGADLRNKQVYPILLTSNKSSALIDSLQEVKL